jgi:O-antigen/teichoic acid export membrane protein
MSFSQIITKIIVGQEFIESWKYMPTILLGTAFFSMAQYLGSVYTASKNTKMAFVTNITAAILNIFLNIVFLKYIGTIGAAVATAICYLFLWIYRMKNTKKIVNIQYDIPRIISTVLLLIINSVIVTTQITFWYIYTTIIILLIIAINRECIINLIKTTVTLIKEKTLIKKKV